MSRSTMVAMIIMTVAMAAASIKQVMVADRLLDAIANTASLHVPPSWECVITDGAVVCRPHSKEQP